MNEIRFASPEYWEVIKRLPFLFKVYMILGGIVFWVCAFLGFVKLISF